MLCFPYHAPDLSKSMPNLVLMLYAIDIHVCVLHVNFVFTMIFIHAYIIKIE